MALQHIEHPVLALIEPRCFALAAKPVVRFAVAKLPWRIAPLQPTTPAESTAQTTGTATMRRLGQKAPAQQTHRATKSVGGVIRDRLPEGQGDAMRSLGGAIAGTLPGTPID